MFALMILPSRWSSWVPSNRAIPLPPTMPPTIVVSKADTHVGSAATRLACGSWNFGLAAHAPSLVHRETAVRRDARRHRGRLRRARAVAIPRRRPGAFAGLFLPRSRRPVQAPCRHLLLARRVLRR